MLEQLTPLLDLDGADETSISVHARHVGSTRFANNRPTQSVDTDETIVEVRVVVDGRVGAARAGSVTNEVLTRTHRQAIEVARAQTRVPKTPVAFPGVAALAELTSWAEATAKADAMVRADVLRPLFATAQNKKTTCAGLLLAVETERACVSSRGIRAHCRQTFSRLRLIASHESDSSGHAASAHRDIRKLDCAPLVEQAITRAELAKNPKVIEPGSYDVVLEPPAVRELLEWLGTTAFHARAIHDGTSALAGKMGESIMGDNVTIVDDPTTSAQGMTPRPFDSEGVPSRRVELVSGGIARGVVSDSQSGALIGTTSTGHAPPIIDELADRPVPSHLHFAPGQTKRAELLECLGKGLLVTRFHYVNGLLDTRRATMTGLTRDGLFVVENGNIVGAAQNMRWMNSLLEAFCRIEAISMEVETVPTWWSDESAFVVPALLVRGWNFTSLAG